MPLNPESLASFENMEEANPPEPPRSAADPVLPCAQTWVAVELLGPDGLPVPGAEYEIVLPDGRVRRGVLDAQGYAMERNIGAPGTCRVSFPGREDIRPR